MRNKIQSRCFAAHSRNTRSRGVSLLCVAVCALPRSERGCGLALWLRASLLGRLVAPRQRRHVRYQQEQAPALPPVSP
jgi:hypothetical protein